MQIFPRAPNESVKTAFAKAWLNLSGVATPDGPHPTGRRVSILRYRIGGAFITLIGVATAYVFIVRPIVQASRMGELHQGIFGLVMPVVLLYWGLATLVTDLRDEKSLVVGPDGKLWWTRRARMSIYGMLITVVVWLVVWYLYVRGLRLDVYLQ